MNINSEGLKLIKNFEGCYLNAYKDCVGVWTIGYGTTNSDKSITGTTIKAGLKISQKTADEWLEKSINLKYCPLVEKYQNKYNFNENEFSALVSFAYNIGSIDQLTANGTRSKKVIAEKFSAYNKAGGKVFLGLTRRRIAERALFLKAVEEKHEEEKKIENIKTTDDYIFNSEIYHDIYEDLRKVFGDNYGLLKQHWLQFGVKEGRLGSLIFDANYYKNKYSDLKEAFKNNTGSYYAHYIQFGISEGRIASEFFDLNYYKENNKDLKEAFGDDNRKYIIHFVEFGIKEGRIGNPEFNVIAYKNNYEDLRKAFGDDYLKYYIHYVVFGKKENRKAK